MGGGGGGNGLLMTFLVQDISSENNLFQRAVVCYSCVLNFCVFMYQWSTIV